MNIADRYLDGGSHGYWHDGHLRVKGPILHSLLHQFAADWNFMGRPCPTASPWPIPSHRMRNGACNLSHQARWANGLR